MTCTRALIVLALCLIGLAPMTADAGTHDGTWRASRTSSTCPEKDKLFTFRIVNGQISGPRSGSVDATGNLTLAFRNHAKHYTYRAKLGPTAGAGTWQRQMFNGRQNCGGALSLRRIR